MSSRPKKKPPLVERLRTRKRRALSAGLDYESWRAVARGEVLIRQQFRLYVAGECVKVFTGAGPFALPDSLREREDWEMRRVLADGTEATVEGVAEWRG